MAKGFYLVAQHSRPRPVDNVEQTAELIFSEHRARSSIATSPLSHLIMGVTKRGSFSICDPNLSIGTDSVIIHRGIVAVESKQAYCFGPVVPGRTTMLEFGRSQLTLGSDSGSEPVVAKYHGGLNIGKSSTSYYVGAETDCEREVNLLSRLLNALVLLGVLLPLLVDTVQGKCPELPPPGGCIGDLDYASFTVLLIAVSAIMAIGYGCYRLVARLRKRG